MCTFLSFKIAEVDTAKERFLLTLKPSDLKMGNRLSQKEVFEDSLVQFERLLGERDLLLRDQGRPWDLLSRDQGRPWDLLSRDQGPG